MNPVSVSDQIRDAYAEFEAVVRASLMDAAKQYLDAGIPVDKVLILLEPIARRWHEYGERLVVLLQATVERHDGRLIH